MNELYEDYLVIGGALLAGALVAALISLALFIL